MIDFNRPAFTGREFDYIRDAVQRGMLCGDGEYTKRCSQWMMDKFHVNHVMLTTSCTHALEMAAHLCDIKPGVVLIYFAIMFAVAELLPRLLHADREDYGAYQVMTLFSNIGFMGYPLLDVMYGSNAIIHAVIFNLLYNVLIYTYGIHKMQIGGCQKNINWKQLVNIGVGDRKSVG